MVRGLAVVASAGNLILNIFLALDYLLKRWLMEWLLDNGKCLFSTEEFLLRGL